ncbi:unnamed protein product [Nezara viridula]|uniref:Uncharacterized protein n=1 Tax=Nezara viridula TaxID=85310 RepID=A0A9P0H2F4_NEZVI|nr:unnamed protein product [Nezara viridula]
MVRIFFLASLTPHHDVEAATIDGKKFKDRMEKLEGSDTEVKLLGVRDGGREQETEMTGLESLRRRRSM